MWVVTLPDFSQAENYRKSFSPLHVLPSRKKLIRHTRFVTEVCQDAYHFCPLLLLLLLLLLLGFSTTAAAAAAADAAAAAAAAAAAVDPESGNWQPIQKQRRSRAITCHSANMFRKRRVVVCKLCGGEGHMAKACSLPESASASAAHRKRPLQQPLSVTMSSNEGRQLQHRLDVRAETSAFADRPLLLWAFRSGQLQLQAVFDHSQPSRCVSAAQSLAFSSNVRPKQRQSFLTCSRLCVTLAVRLLRFGCQCAVKYPWRKAACILSRRHVLPGRLGAVATAGEGFMRVIGRKGAGNGQFHHPCGGGAFDDEGNLVVCDNYNRRIQVFKYSDGTHLRSIRSQINRGWLHEPWRVAFDGAGHIIVCERTRSRVHVLRYSDGAHVRTIGGKCSGNGEFRHPSGIAVDSEGNVAVLDTGNARVQVHRLNDGAYIRTIGSRSTDNGQFGRGDGDVAFDSEGNLVVADCDNHRVQVLRYSDGAHVRTIGSYGTGAGQFNNPTGVAFDAAGHIVVVERGNDRVQVLRYSDGAHVRTIGGDGSSNRQFSGVWGGIAIDSNGLIVVADTFNNRVQVRK